MSSRTIDYTQYPVPRIRHHANPTLYLPESNHHVQLSYYPPVVVPDWRDHFANAQPPSWLDVGSGMGKFLIETALEHPEKNILGFELRKTAVDWVQSVLRGEQIPNASLLWYSVVNGLQFIERASIEKIFYFFPDPWVKKKHHKRRAFSRALLDEFARMLRPDGTLYLMTDVPEVDQYQQEVLREHEYFTAHYVHTDAEWGLTVRTDQERFSLKKSIPYVRVICTPARQPLSDGAQHDQPTHA